MGMLSISRKLRKFCTRGYALSFLNVDMWRTAAAVMLRSLSAQYDGGSHRMTPLPVLNVPVYKILFAEYWEGTGQVPRAPAIRNTSAIF